MSNQNNISPDSIINGIISDNNLKKGKVLDNGGFGNVVELPV
mgnify:CR=1 FL=1